MMPIREPRITLRRILKAFFGFTLLTLIAAYVLFQARNFILGPSIVLTREPSPIQTERVVEIQGTAKNIVKISLNGREIHTDETGVFREKLVLENGYTIMTLMAKDRFGRETTLERGFLLDQEGRLKSEESNQ